MLAIGPLALVPRYIYSWGSVFITLVTTVAFLSKTEKLPSLPFNLSPWPSHYHMTVKNRALTASGSPKQFFALASTTICIVFSDRPSLPETNRCTPDNGAIPLLPTIMLGLHTDLLLVMSKKKCKKGFFASNQCQVGLQNGKSSSLPETNRRTPDNAAIPLLPILLGLHICTNLLLAMYKKKRKKLF